MGVVGGWFCEECVVGATKHTRVLITAFFVAGEGEPLAWRSGFAQSFRLCFTCAYRLRSFRRHVRSSERPCWLARRHRQRCLGLIDWSDGRRLP